MITRFLHVLILFALLGTAQHHAAGSVGAAKTIKSQPPQKTQTEKTQTDAQIERTIKTKLAKSKLNADHFTVSVTRGVATIEGSTNVMQHKGAMTHMAKVSGATSVRNNIRISDAAKAKAVAALAKHRDSASTPGLAQAPLSSARGVTSSKTSQSPPSPTPSPAPAPIPKATVLPAGVSR